ncbi:MAG: DUF2309 domain-containing protein [Acidobacteria bacterium]|nr:DUF2309 domain-containing protein [Acidobacteriota bacterium]
MQPLETLSEPAHSRSHRLHEILHHVAHLLPVQGPIGVFVHHNTLHAFEDRTFEDAVSEAARIFGAEPYMKEEAYREQLRRGRILEFDIEEVIAEEPDSVLLPQFGITRRTLQRAVLISGIRPFEAGAIGYMLHEGGLLMRLRTDLEPAKRARILEAHGSREGVAARKLFAACLDRVKLPSPAESAASSRIRDGLLASAGVDLDDFIHPYLIRFSEVFLDQGLAYWPMPDRDLGFYASVRKLITQPLFIEPKGLSGLCRAFAQQARENADPTRVVLQFLDSFRIPEQEWSAYLQAELLALPGWAGLFNRIEQEPYLLEHNRIPCSLLDFLAVRLTMTRVAAGNISQEAGLDADFASQWQTRAEESSSIELERLRQAARMFDVAQLLGLSALTIRNLSAAQFDEMQFEVSRLDDLECRRLLHQAYERRHERLVLEPLACHRRLHPPAERKARPKAQVFFCIDEREESIRRHLEEYDPDIETFAAAGFFGVAVDYAGIDDPHGVPLCPVVVKPQHAVREVPVEQDERLTEQRRARRAIWSRFAQLGLTSSRTIVNGWISTAVLGILSLFPLIARVIAPRQFARLREKLNKSFLPEPRTELTLMRKDAEGQHVAEGLLVGFSPDEKTDRVESVLGPAGLRTGFARLVIVLGHGSTSLNNPHESAHDCGACGGRRGGPNARLFAAMANLPHVRDRLRSKGIFIPQDTWFVGGYHDTCNDDIDLFDLEQVPDSHREELAAVRASLDRARAGNAHERARRFEAADPNHNSDLALQHVEERSEHLAEPRPEYGHCTNAVCFVGRRATTRGLFLDRRAFLVSYDASQDPEDRDLLRLLGAVVPVCAGISLEYYFSFVDNERYGCGTKLPHNVTGLIGVMNGQASDLRTGLPWQMVEIHEPVRILFVVETTPDRLLSTFRKNPALNQLLTNRWVRIAAMDPVTGRIQTYRNGIFEPLRYIPEHIGTAANSMDWYRGMIEHLPAATIQASL